LSGGDSRIRLSAMLILAKQNKVPVEAVGALTESLDDKDPRIRFGAGILLTKIGPDAASAVPALLHALNDRDPAVRYSTVYALDAIKSSPDKVVPAFIGILRHEGESVLVRKTVIRGLGDFGAGARDAVPVLTDLLTSSTTSIVIASARALGAIGAPAASALPELHKAAERNIEEYAKSVVGDAIKAIELDMGEEE
jgi:HEAT repeat protein